MRGKGECVERGRKNERKRGERERERRGPELPLMLLQPFDNSPPRESREEGGEGGEKMLLS